jgi:hypothetical protein
MSGVVNAERPGEPKQNQRAVYRVAHRRACDSFAANLREYRAAPEPLFDDVSIRGVHKGKRYNRLRELAVPESDSPAANESVRVCRCGHDRRLVNPKYILEVKLIAPPQDEAVTRMDHAKDIGVPYAVDARHGGTSSLHRYAQSESKVKQTIR